MGDMKLQLAESINNSPIVETASGPFGRLYAMTADSLQYTKRAVDSGWNLVPMSDSGVSPTINSGILQLLLVFEHQAADQPDHWSLFLAREGAKGTVYQVTGDAEAMHYSFIEDTNPVTELDTFNTAFVMAESISPEQQRKVVVAVEHMVPPSAPNAAAVKENCQTWCAKVLVQLMRENIVERRKVEEAAAMMGLVRGKVKPVIDLD